MLLKFLFRSKNLETFSIAAVHDILVSNPVHIAGHRIAIWALCRTQAITFVTQVVLAWLQIYSDLNGKLTLGTDFGHFFCTHRINLHMWLSDTLRVLP